MRGPLLERSSPPISADESPPPHCCPISPSPWSSAIAYDGWIFYSRWNYAREAEKAEQLKQAQERVTRWNYWEAIVSRFSTSTPAHQPSAVASGPLICYGVNAAERVRIEPPVEQLHPAFSHCLQVSPLRDTDYKLIAEDRAGHIGQPRASPSKLRLNAHANPCLIRFERCTRQFRHRSMVTVPSGFSTPAAPSASASSFDTTCSDSLDPGGSFCPQPSQYRPLFLSTATKIELDLPRAPDRLRRSPQSPPRRLCFRPLARSVPPSSTRAMPASPPRSSSDASAIKPSSII